MRLSASDIAQYAAAAGFAGNDLTTAVAVAFAESSGKTDAFNPEGSYGLWQIYVPAHPEFAGWNLYDPASNAAAAFRTYANAGNRFTPWSAFKNGAYTRYLTGSQSAVDALNGGVQLEPGVTVLPPQLDPGANGSADAMVPAGGQIQQLPGWVWIAAGVVGLVIFMQE